MGVGRRLKILHLEDDDSFCGLLSLTFRRAGLEVDLISVDAREAFWAALESGSIDIVISDGSVGGYEGLAAIQELRERSLELPVIFLSGALPLGGTAPLLAAGATEFLLKDDLPAVVECIRRLGSLSGARAGPLQPRPPLDQPRAYVEAADAASEADASRSEWSALSRLIGHDLRNPLWRIQGFAELLRDDYASALDDDGTVLIREVLRGTKELNGLLDGAGQLVKISTAPFSPRAFDITRAANHIASELSAAAPLRSVQWCVGEGLTVHADPQLLEVALEHLLANAFKFTSKCVHARIEVTSAGSDAGLARFLVRDNGVGFDPTQASGLFVPFRRLHAGDDYPGVGMGLALVAQIVRRHGGHVWCEGARDLGATFFFGLPSSNDGDC